MKNRRVSFVLEAVDADLETWLRGQANMSAVIRAGLVEERERPRRLARIEEKVDALGNMLEALLARCAPRPAALDIAGLSDADRETLAALLEKYGK